MPYALEIDPTSEDATNVPLVLTSSTVTVLEESFPMPPVVGRFIDQEQADGEQLDGLRYGNRTISLRVECRGSTAAAMRTALLSLLAKVGKINREGGTLKRTSPSNETVVFDLLTAEDVDPELDVKYHNGNVAVVPVRFVAKPYGRGTEYQVATLAETTLPYASVTLSSVPGDASALGRIVVSETQATDQGAVIWGMRSRYYDSASTAGLFYEAESRTPLGGAATATTSGASGGTPNSVTKTGLPSTYVAVLSTQASGGGSHLTHTGRYRVLSRMLKPSTNTGQVSVAFEWALGDFRSYTRNTTISPAVQGAWCLVDLGVVYLPPPAKGSRRWEGRVVAKSTGTTDAITVDWLMLVPVDDGYGTATGLLQVPSPTTYTAQDDFSGSGALTGATADTGGVWAGAGSATDFSMASGAVSRTATSDSSFGGRYATVGSAIGGTNVKVNVTGLGGTFSRQGGALARYIDTNNWLLVSKSQSGGSLPRLNVTKRIAGTITLLASPVLRNFESWVEVVVIGGRWVAYAGTASTAMVAVAAGYDADLATGGTLASGKVGIYHENTGATSGTGTFDDFSAWSPPADAAVFASRQAEIRWDGAIRQDSAGTVWVPQSRYEGDLVLIPPAGPESRTSQLLAKTSRGGIGDVDPNTDDLTLTVFATPRYLVIP